MDVDLFPGLSDLLEMIDVLSEKIRGLDRDVETACARCPAGAADIALD